MVSEATPIEVSSMKIWPEGEDVRPTYTWFLNERIELLATANTRTETDGS